MGLAAATASLWSTSRGLKAFAQAPLSGYRAVVVITLDGGNDGNNTIVPFDAVEYAQYASLRGGLRARCGFAFALAVGTGSQSYGFHPALVNIHKLLTSRNALSWSQMLAPLRSRRRSSSLLITQHFFLLPF